MRRGERQESDGQQRNRHRELERCWGFRDRQSVFFLWVLKRDLCHLQTRPHFLWLSSLKYSICQCHGPSQRAASHVCWLRHSPIYIRHWQHHHVPNVLLACSCSILCRGSSLCCLVPLLGAPICIVSVTAAQQPLAATHFTRFLGLGARILSTNLKGVALFKTLNCLFLSFKSVPEVPTSVRPQTLMRML